MIGTGGSGGITGGRNGNIVLTGNASPGLAPLGDYGGPTETIALLPGSPALGTGTAVAGVTTDQRGFAANPVDIGEFQSQAGPLVVNTTIDGLGSPSGDLSLRQAINLANVLTGGATIKFNTPIYTVNQTIILTAGQLALTNTTGPITIDGPGSGRLTVSGNDLSRVFQVDSGVTAAISGLTITGGSTTGDGGGLNNEGDTTLTDVEVNGNTANDGGAIFNSGALIAVGLIVDDNQALDGGGIDNSGTATIVAASVSENTAGHDGGGIDNSGSLAISLSSITGNTALADGGGLFNDGNAILVLCASRATPPPAVAGFMMHHRVQ